MGDPLHSSVTALLAGRVPAWSGVDPERAAELLVRKGLAGLAVAEERRLGDRAGGGMPDGLRRRLEPFHARWGLHSTLVLEMAHRATAALRGAGVDALLFKGTALLERAVYPDPGARLMEDADVLVRPAAASAAVEALTGAGFEPWGPWRETRTRWSPSLTLRDTSASVPLDLDLHWAVPYASLRSGEATAPDPLWDDADARSGTPRHEAHFVVLAAHFLKHLRVVAHLRGLADLARLAPLLEDGALVRRHAERRGVLPGVRAVLALLEDGLGAPVPGPVVRAVGVTPLGGRTARLLAPERLLDVDGDRGRRVAGLLAEWPLARGWTGSLGEVARVLSPSDRWLRARYGGGRGRLARRARYLRDLWSWVRGRGASPLSPNQGLPG